MLFHLGEKEVEPYNWASISVLFLNWNTILPSWKTVALSSKPTHSLSLQTSRTRGCFFIDSMKSRSSRSRSCLRDFSVESASSRSRVADSSSTLAQLFDGRGHLAHFAHLVFLLPWICSARPTSSDFLPAA